MKQWKRLAALSSAIVMAAATVTYFPSDTLQNIRLEISASAEDASAVAWTKTESDGLTWTLYEDGTLNISGTVRNHPPCKSRADKGRSKNSDLHGGR